MVIGLAMTTACVAGLAMGRFVGAIADGEPAPITRLYLSIEASGAVLAALALRYESRRQRQPPTTSHP